MNRISGSLLAIAMATTLCHGQGSSGGPAPAAAGHGAFPVKVAKTLDSSKLKQGDAVELETAGSFKLPDGTLVPKGSKLRGQVVAAKARSKGDPQSELTLQFDKLDIVNGKQLSVKGIIQAVFPPYEEPEPLMAGKASGAAGGGYSPGSAGGGYGAGTVGTVTDATSGSDTRSSAKSQEDMNPQSKGVHGMHDLSLEDGMLSSSGKQVKLNGGVRMIVHADIYQ